MILSSQKKRNNRNSKFVFGLCFSIFMCSQNTYSQDIPQGIYDKDLQYRKEIIATKSEFLNIAEELMREIIKKHGTQNDLELLKDTDVRLTFNWIPNQAIAIKQRNRNVIEIDIGLVSYIDGYFTSSVIERDLGVPAHTEFLENFYEYVTDGTGGLHDHVYRHFESKQQADRFFSDSSKTNSSSRFNEITTFTIISLGAVALHEFCHHKLGHAEYPLNIPSLEKLTATEISKLSKSSIDREINADKCAIELQVKAGIPPGVSFLASNSIGIFVENSLKRKQQKFNFQSHPVTQNRVFYALSRTEDAMIEFNKLPDAIKANEVKTKAEIAKIIEVLQQEVSALNEIGSK